MFVSRTSEIFTTIQDALYKYSHISCRSHIKHSKKKFDSDFPSPCIDVPKTRNFRFRRGTKPRDQKQETGNVCDIISGIQASRKSDFSDIFLFSYKQRTFVPFLSELISSQ